MAHPSLDHAVSIHQPPHLVLSPLSYSLFNFSDCKGSIHPSIHLELLLHAATKEDVGGLNVLQKSSKEKKKDDLYYDLMHTMCVCRGGSLPTPHRIKVSANSLVLARVSLGATNDGIVQGCLAGLEGLFRRINHMK